MSALSKRSSVVSLPIRLHQPDETSSDSTEDLSQLTLREAFVRFLQADIKAGCEKGTMTVFRVTLNNWELAFPQNPGIGSITDFTLEAFRDLPSLRVKHGEPVPRRAATINKDLRTIHRILRRVGPRGDGNPFGKGIIAQVPYCAKRADDPVRKRFVTQTELAALFVACDVATWPAQRKTSVQPARLWRALLVCLLHWGANIGDLLRLTSASITRGDGSIWKPNLQRYYVEFVRKKTKGKKPEPIVLPVSRTVARHILPLIKPGGRIFRFPTNQRDLAREWNRIHAEAGIELVKPLDDGKEFDNRIYFQDLRKTCTSLYDEIDPGIGEWVLGHAPRGTNKRHYAIVVNRLRKAIARFDRKKQPKIFRRAEELQQRLF